MRKVKNKAVIHNLAVKNYRANKTRNRIAILAIALTAMLFSTLFTIGMGVVDNFQQQTMRQTGGDSHGTIKNLSREQYEKLRKDPSIKESSASIPVAQAIKNPEFIKRRMEIWYFEKPAYPRFFIDIIHGSAPKKAEEILIDETSLKLMGLEQKVGQQVTLQMQLRNGDDTTITRTFTISGIIKSHPAFNVGITIVSDAYLEAYAQELTYTYPEDLSLTGVIQMEVNFDNSFSIQKKIHQVIQNAGYSIDPESPDYIDSNASWAYISDGLGSELTTIAALIMALLLIMFTGYLIIYNVFQIAVVRDIRYYGLLKTIGMTGRQIKKLIRGQAFWMEIVGIPLGLATGFGLGCLLVPKVLSSTTFIGDEIMFSINPMIIIRTAVFSILTVWISVRKPAKIAAKVSPIEAVRYTEQMRSKKKMKKTADGGKHYRMAFSNLGRNKKKTTLVILSLSLAVILLNSVVTYVHSFDMDTYLKRFVSSDFLIGNAEYFNGKYFPNAETVEELALSESFISACEQQEGFESGGRLYGSISAEVGLVKSSWTPPESLTRDENGNLGNYLGSMFFPYFELGLGVPNYATSFYGIEDFHYEILDVWKGESDLTQLKEKMATGDYLLYGVMTDDNDFVHQDEVKHQPGDMITLVYGDGQTREFEILALIKENYSALTNRSSSDFSYYVTADVFKEMVSDQYLMSYAFNAQDAKESTMERFVNDYTTTQEPLMHYESKKTIQDEYDQSNSMTLMVGIILALIIGLVGILNFINAILTSIVTRQKEFAMLEAVGMSKKQLIRMLMLEGLYYAVLTVGASFILGCITSQTMVRAMADGSWFMSYRFIFWPMLLIYPVLLLLGVILPWFAYRPHRKLSMIEQLRASE